jgi:NADH-quinone oxidoreductase subunit F
LIDDFRASAKGRSNGGANGQVLSARDTVGEVRICLCSSCVAGGSRKIYDEVVRQAVTLDLPVTVKDVGCTGLSYETPLLEVQLYNEDRYRYGKVDPVDVRDLLLKHFRPTGWVKRVGARMFHTLETFFTDESWAPPTRYSQDVRHGVEKAYVGSQVRLVTEHAGVLDPRSIEDYLAHDGFKAMEAVLKRLQPEEVIAEVKASGLRGRGGAVFQTGMKWEFTRASKGELKYIICNGDEGDPGAFMDRMILESFPYRVLEGMVICAYAVGAREGFLYIRADYPLATTRIREAIRVCEERGLLGENIMGSGFSLKLRVVEGAGAFVCGEETVLMSAIEGGRGMPRFRPPFPAQSGLWGRPTCINNVESFASVPWIMRNGAKAYSAYGTEKSKGTKTFALAGKVRRGGLIEVLMGMTIHEIVNDIGGGVPERRKLKAVLMGGPSGGCVPAHLSHTPVDYEALKSVGAIMGSGGMVVLDDSDCIVDVALYFLAFTQDESCGKCTHCRIGTKRMKEILDRLCTGKGRKGDQEMLETLSDITIEGSLCGLGKTAPNPVLSSLRYYREEYEAHVRGECPSRKCKSLVQYFITDTCFGCTRCSQMCPTDSIPMNPYHRHVIEESTCTRCDICKQVCPVNAIEVLAL